MAATWDVNTVLDEVMGGIDLASGRTFEATALHDLREVYRAPFQTQHDAGADWSRDAPIILERASEVGLLARQMATERSLTKVDSASALMAGYTVSLYCRYGESGSVDGRDRGPGHGAGGPESGVYCNFFPRPSSAARGDLRSDVESARRVLAALRCGVSPVR